MKELDINLPVRPAAGVSAAAKRVQEWLCFHRSGVVIDGEYGPATAAAVRSFQLRNGISEIGVDVLTWRALVAPMAAAVGPVEFTPGDTVRTILVKSAKQHLAQHPLEIGGENRGPWVRLYMKGSEGRIYPWCAGFAMFLVEQACGQVGQPVPVPYRWGCDELAGLANVAGRLTQANPEPGWLFLVRKKEPKKEPNHWSHIGIVIATDRAGTMTTVEGNTNDSGSPEGFEVCQRTRSVTGKDFIRI